MRIRFIGTHGPSEWSNVLEVNGGEVKDQTTGATGSGDEPTTAEPEDDKCPLCGFCPQPLGLCIFIWIAIILAVIIIVIIVISATRKKDEKENNPK